MQEEQGVVCFHNFNKMSQNSTGKMVSLEYNEDSQAWLISPPNSQIVSDPTILFDPEPQNLKDLIHFYQTRDTRSMYVNPNNNKKRKSCSNYSQFELSEFYEFKSGSLVRDDYLCYVCADILKEPVSHSCGQLCCYRCFNKSRNGCPTCRGPLKDSLPAPKIIMRELEKVPIVCQKCKEVMNMEKFVHHFQHQCKGAICTDCGLVFNGDKLLQQHIPDCANLTVDCEAANCLFLENNNNEFGCCWRGKQQEYLSTHRPKCPFITREFFRKIIDGIQEYKDCLTEIKQLEHQRHFQKKENTITQDDLKSCAFFWKVDRIHFYENKACLDYSHFNQFRKQIEPIHEHIDYVNDENLDKKTKEKIKKRLYRLADTEDFYAYFNPKYGYWVRQEHKPFDKVHPKDDKFDNIVLLENKGLLRDLKQQQAAKLSQ